MDSVEQTYFIVSGTVMRASSHMRKKLSIAVREVNIMAVCDNMSTRWLRNSLGETPMTFIRG